jgi:Holliday junction resolvasome RuvABC DNA-binding subunit
MIESKTYDLSDLKKRLQEAVARYEKASNVVETLNEMGFTVTEIDDGVITVARENALAELEHSLSFDARNQSPVSYANTR